MLLKEQFDQGIHCLTSTFQTQITKYSNTHIQILGYKVKFLNIIRQNMAHISNFLLPLFPVLADIWDMVLGSLLLDPPSETENKNNN